MSSAITNQWNLLQCQLLLSSLKALGYSHCSFLKIYSLKVHQYCNDHSFRRFCVSLLRSYHQYAACSNCSPWKENIRFDEKCKFGYPVVIKFSLVTSHSVCLDVSQEMALSNFHKMWSRG